MADDHEGWVLLKDGADKVAKQRLGDLNQLITSTVTQFHTEAAGQVEGLEGGSQDGMGAAMFTAITSVIASAFPNGGMALGAITSFRDVLVSGITQAAANSSAGRLAQAKDELRRVLGELAAATRDSAEAAWYESSNKVDESLDALFNERPDLKNLEFDDNAAWTEGWLCDQIGIRDAHVADPSHRIIGPLWEAFHHDYYRAAARVRWADRSHGEKLQFLAEMDGGEREPFLVLMGEDPRWWEIELQRWLSGNTGGPSMHQ